MIDGGRAGFVIWYTFRWLFMILAVLFLISGVDDLFFDLVHYTRVIYRKLFMGRLIRPVTVRQLDEVPEQRVAIMIPAWDESAVIARMLLNTLGTLRYKNYKVFVGTYPNDEATRREAEKVREIYPNIELAVTPIDGPTNKADCLNWIYQEVLLYEKEHGVTFEFYVMHDAEDLVHPLSLKYFNYLMPRMDFIQLPVFPLEGRWYDFVTGVYMDEFAESHTKDLRVREYLAAYLPSAGVGTAISRRAMDYLAAQNRNQVFDISTLTEDYEMGLNLKDLKGKKIFLQQRVERVESRRSPWSGKMREHRVLEPVATREFFPKQFSAAVRQRSRWILGIGLQGWGMGWTRRLNSDYCLYRDRKAVLANLLTVVGYVVAVYWLGCLVAPYIVPGVQIPPLISRGEVFATAVFAILGLLLWRLANRVVSTWRIYGFAHALLVPPRLIYANILNFCATWVAIRRYVAARISRQVPAWGKTAHAWPTEDQLRQYHLKLGDLLLERRLVTTKQLEAALTEQAVTGEKLGAILIRQGVLWDEDLMVALARQRHVEAVEIDPFAVPEELIKLVPLELAERYQVFPLEMNGETVVMAADDRVDINREGLAAELGRKVAFKLCAPIDLHFALYCGYRPDAAGRSLEGRVGARLLRSGKITEPQLKEALRRQKRTGQRIGDILVGMKVIKQDEVEHELSQ
jgi:adsorption protein B